MAVQCFESPSHGQRQASPTRRAEYVIDLPAHLIELRLQGVHFVSAFLEHDPAHHRVDVGVGQRHADLVAVLERREPVVVERRERVGVAADFLAVLAMGWRSPPGAGGASIVPAYTGGPMVKATPQWLNVNWVDPFSSKVPAPESVPRIVNWWVARSGTPASVVSTSMRLSRWASLS